MSRIPVILDVDTGVDDSLAILYACASPEVELVAVTCVAGNVPARQVAKNSLAVLELAGRSDVPVILGAEQPLIRQLVTAEDTHGPQGLGHATLPAAKRGLESGHAAGHLVELVRERPGEILLVTLGPLTNLALALDRERALPTFLGGYALMGGAYRVPGNTTPTTEWNIHVDPDAAKAVFAAWAATPNPASDRPLPRPLAMGLDVTELKPFLPPDLARLGMRAGCSHIEAASLATAGDLADRPQIDNPIVQFVADALRFYFEFHAANDGFYGAYIHDPFAVAAALDRSLVTTRPVFVDVEAGPGLASGMAVTDWRGLTKHAPNLDVAIDGETSTFIDRLIERVGGLAADASGVSR
ncbi:MAG TPA: nucleoside hydrolase [Candidatus Limnocylindrales bacterium]|nr:nucleoside hydrolase [Candidatus Limnocylindrales bacterium]